MHKTSFTVDDHHLIVGNVTIPLFGAQVNGKEIPEEYVKLLLQKETRKEAVSLLRRIDWIVQVEKGKTNILEIAGHKGLETATKVMDDVEQANPHGKPELYRSISTERRLFDREERRIVITDGKNAFSFPTSDELGSLPPNVYCKEEELYVCLALENLKNVDITEFFEITKGVSTAWHIHACQYNEQQTILNAFLGNPEKGRKLLKPITLFTRFRSDALQTPQGIIMSGGQKVFNKSGWQYGYLITEKAQIFRFVARNLEGMRNLVVDVVENGKQIPRLKSESPPKNELTAISKRIGRLAPAIALALLPA